MELNLHADTIDSREIQARIDWLESEIEAIDAEIGDNPHPDDFVSEREDLAEYKAERDMLVAFRESLHADANWKWGITFIRDHFFEEYAKEYAEDIGGFDRYAWPMNHINWSAAAESFQSDYIDCELDGETYWFNA